MAQNKDVCKKDNKKLDVIWITKVLTVFLGLVVLAADVFSKVISEYVVYCFVGELNNVKVYCLMGVIYLASVVAIILLIFLYKLLVNLGNGKVFVKDNVKNLRVVAGGLLAIAACATAGMYVHTSLFLIAYIMLFVALIVFCVQLVFNKAIEMKDELDFTV